ncbi:MAG TPA: DMT family transporter [Tabrizicola sp.]|nr:DMT family transporter [Tabrizicola sp.]
MRYGHGVALCLAAGTVWSLMGLGLRQIEEASVWAILFWRSVGMIPVLFAFIWWNSGGRALGAIRAVGVAGVLGGLALVVAFAGAIYAFQTTTVANAVLLFAASPFVAAVLGWIALREAVRPLTWVAIAIAVFGMYLMVRDGLGTGAMLGNLAALLSAAGFGAYTVVLRWGRVGEMLPVALLGAVFAVLVAGVILPLQGEVILVSAHDMAVAMAIGAIVVALGMVMFTLGSKVVTAAELTLLSLVEVLLGPIWVWLFLGEKASRNTLIGGSVLLAAVVLNGLVGSMRKPAEGVAERVVP